MIFNEVIGNISEINDLNGYHVETIYLNSEDMIKRILRVTSDHNREYGITLENNEKLKDGDILYNEDKKIIVVKVNSEDVLIIKPSSITEMGVIKRDNVNYSRENITLKKAFKHVEFAHTH